MSTGTRPVEAPDGESSRDPETVPPSTSASRLIAGALVTFVLSCGVFWMDTRLITLPPSWLTFEFCQYAEIGRNLATEGTFDTRLVEPMALALIDRERASRSSGRWPVVNRYPWPCFVVAGLMKLRGPGDVAAAWSNGLAIGLLAALTYVVAARGYGPKWGAVAGLLFLVNPSFYGEFVLLGTPDVWFATIFVAELLVWSLPGSSQHRPARPGWAFVLGLLGGLAFLARFNVTLFLAVQAGWLVARRRWRDALVFGTSAAAVATPLLAYNWHHFRTPVVSLYSAWNLLDEIGAYRVEPWLYYRIPDLPAELSAHAGGFFRKWATNLFRRVPSRAWSLWRLDVLLPLAPIGLAISRPKSSTRRLAAWSIGLFALQLVVFSALRLELEDRDSPHAGRYFFWFAAPALVLGLGVLRRLGLHSRAGKLVAIVAIVGQLGLFAMAWRDMALRQPREVNLGRDPIRGMLVEVVADGQVIASNQPQITAWCCGLRSISLPADPAELARLNRDSPTPADYLFIDTNSNWINLDRRWALLAANTRGIASPWEAGLLTSYEYALPPARTRPMMYVLLRRRGVSPGPLERRYQASTSRPAG